jgi:hypothetical protein
VVGGAVVVVGSVVVSGSVVVVRFSVVKAALDVIVVVVVSDGNADPGVAGESHEVSSAINVRAAKIFFI